MTPANDLRLVRSLAADESTCIFFSPVLVELGKHSLDSDDLLAIIGTELGETHCFKSKSTEKYHPSTTSDYFSIWVGECGCRMFIKLLIAENDGKKMLVVTSFKKDSNYDIR